MHSATARVVVTFTFGLPSLAPVALLSQAQRPPAVTTARALNASDYAKWETLGAAALSPDGKWVAYDFRRGDGSTAVVYRAAIGGTDRSTAMGIGPQFSRNSRWLVFTLLPDTIGTAGRAAAPGRAASVRTADAGVTHDKVSIVDLRTGAATTVDDIQSYRLSTDGAHIAMRRYSAPGRRGSDVIVRDLDAGTDLTVGNVTDLAWNDDGNLLALIIDVDGNAGNGVQLLNVTTGALRALDAGDTRYTGLQWRPRSSDLAVLRSRVDSAFLDTGYVVLAWRGLPSAAVKQSYDFVRDSAFPAGMRVTGYRPPQWSGNGSTLVLGIAPREPRPPVADRAAEKRTPARVQVWHWKDVREFHEQEVAGAQDRRRTTPVSWTVGAGTVSRISTDPYEVVQYATSGAAALALDAAPYSRDYISGRGFRDVYRVDVNTGSRDKVAGRSLYGATLSPSGRYVLYQQNGRWWSLDMLHAGHTTSVARGASNEHAAPAPIDLTSKLQTSFVNAEDDHPVPEHRAYGMAGFTDGERAVILYDRFDLWLLNLDGTKATRLTRGREDSTVYRCIAGLSSLAGAAGPRAGAPSAPALAPCSLDVEGQTIDPVRPLVLTASGERDKKSGYATLNIGKPAEKLIWLDKQVSGLRKARDANVFLFETQSYEESPNYFVAGPTFTDAHPVSRTNAFQSEHAWGRQELLDYRNARGDVLQMMLTYPADYRPGRKYPMVVYYYEKLSAAFHQYVVPSDRSPYNTTNFSQAGYFVLRPDVVFQPRNPGYSGLDCVSSAVRTVLAQISDIDAARIGNMGHSWGGYQSAFYAVHGHGMFAATIAGAPLPDLVSMYGYTSGNSGLPETGHYETSQERMEVPLWEDPQAYIRNSTVFAVDSLQTPLLLEEGDADGNVNHFQSEELYNFGRRLGKNVVYLVYEGENHGVARPESQADYTRRQLEWFAHYLKGEPAQPWITDGESYLARQKILKNAPASSGPP